MTTEEAAQQSRFAQFTRAQLAFRCSVFEKKQNDLLRKLSDANSRNLEYQKEIRLLKARLEASNGDIPKQLLGELLERVGKEFQR